MHILRYIQAHLKRQLASASIKNTFIFKCLPSAFKRQLQKMVKHTQIITRQQPTNSLSVFDHLDRFLDEVWHNTSGFLDVKLLNFLTTSS